MSFGPNGQRRSWRWNPASRMLRLRYMAQGIIRVPIPDAEELPEELKG